MCTVNTLGTLYERVATESIRTNHNRRARLLAVNGLSWVASWLSHGIKSQALFLETDQHRVVLTGRTDLQKDEGGKSYRVVDITPYIFEEPLTYMRPNAARLDVQSSMPVRAQYSGTRVARVESFEDRLTVPEAFRIIHGFAQDALRQLVDIEPVNLFR